MDQVEVVNMNLERKQVHRVFIDTMAEKPLRGGATIFSETVERQDVIVR